MANEKTVSARKSAVSVQYMTRIAILAAIASILFLIEIPVIAFYKLDLSNLPALLGGFSMGPLAGVMILAIKSLIGLLHSSSAGVGEIADFLMGAAFIVPAALIYRARKSKRGAVAGMAAGTVCMIIAGVLANKFILIPFFMSAFHMSMEGIVGMAQKALVFVDSEWKLLLCVTAPFNLLKGFAISFVTALIYKPLSPLLHVSRR